ncbi:metallophosphoesterase family protein [Algiphilus sp.]|uniref:metallophosphoesterase family protein n=1 Tax=Algiphilus sp. TaxID=1872431 RepID=UPI003B5266C3
MDAIRLCLLADTHGILDPRIAAVAQGCDHVVHAGDIGSEAVLDECAAGTASVHGVRGNNDTAEKWRGDPAICARLPASIRLALPGGTLAVVHGDAWPARDRHRRLRAAYPDAAAVLYGHSHRLIVDDSARPWILNPGAAGRARTYGGPSCLLLSVSDSAWEIAVQRFAKA